MTLGHYKLIKGLYRSGLSATICHPLMADEMHQRMLEWELNAKMLAICWRLCWLI